MNAGVEAFRAKLASLGVKNIGIYIGTYFMEEHSISTDKFTALWIPTYGTMTVTIMLLLSPIQNMIYTSTLPKDS